MRPHYEAIVVGSGYGGGIAACRLARAGQRVAVIERGREFAIGEFPDRLSELAQNFQMTTADRQMGSRTALFDYRVNDDIDILMGCGLGGTSLINANVCLKPDARVFDDPVWPEEVRQDGLLGTGFARARAMLRPQPYRGPDLLKLKAMAASAERLGAELTHPPLHIAFSETVNAANVLQPACTLCGDCCAGCNVGAKTTVQVSYLADAYQHGAEIFTEIGARFVRRDPSGGWQVSLRRVRDHDSAPGDAAAPPHEDIVITAPIVILAAGTLGTAEILMRSRDMGLALSDQIGRNFTGNGDALAVGFNCDRPINNVGVGHPSKTETEPVGPAVAGLIDLRGTDDVDAGVALVEAALPSALSPVLATTFAAGHLPFGEDSDAGLRDELNEFGRALKSLVKGAYSGAVRNSQTYLGIGHDEASGELVMVNDRIQVRWPGAGTQKVFQVLDEAFAKSIAANGGAMLKNPLSKPALGNKLTSVHPLGGCVMAADRNSGVVNHKGQVFNGAKDVAETGVLSGLYVSDGSVLPRSVGIHPLFTISALAERTMIHLLRDSHYPLDDAPVDATKPLVFQTAPPKSRTPSLTARLADAFGLGSARR
jgi:cholesterol oxidase